MTFPLRILTLVLLLTGTEWLAACSQKADPTPQPQAPVQTGAVVGQATPAAALTSVTATPIGGSTAYTATLNPTGAYAFASLPVGTYTIAYVAASGYVNPPAQPVTVTANNTSTLPVLTVLAQAGAAAGQVLPAGALTGATATPTGGGTAYPAAVNAATGQYTFANLPLGNYAVTYVVAAGYPTPAAQVATVTAGATATLPTLTLQLNPALLLTNRDWVLTAQRISPGIFIGGTTTTDLYAQLSACSKDDFIRFEAPNVLKIDEGPTKCSSSDPQTQTGTWTFNSSQSVITVVLQGQSQDLAVVSLTDISLVFMTTQTAGGITYTVTSTYRKN